MFSERIRMLRGEKHLTQAEVAREVGLSARGYQDLELGATPRGDTLLAIAEFYGVSIDWLMGARTHGTSTAKGPAPTN